VEDALRLQDDSGVFGEILELSNGCVCCSVNGDFAVALEALSKRQHFDYMFLECSGLADAGPLARMFWVDEELEGNVFLDAIVTLVDAKYLEAHMHNAHPHSRQVVRQIAYADRVVLNKMDLVSAEDIERLTATMAGINVHATVCATHHSKVNLSDILHIRAFESSSTLASTTLAHHNHDHDHDHDHDCKEVGCKALSPKLVDDSALHVHDHSIFSLIIDAADIDVTKLRQWLADLLWIYKKDGAAEGQEVAAGEQKASTDTSKGEQEGEMEVFRMKAVLSVAGQDKQWFLQGVQDMFEIEEGTSDWPVGDQPRVSRLVVIGRCLDEERLTTGFLASQSHK
jgi:G3E family GTPase